MPAESGLSTHCACGAPKKIEQDLEAKRTNILKRNYNNQNTQTHGEGLTVHITTTLHSIFLSMWLPLRLPTTEIGNHQILPWTGQAVRLTEREELKPFHTLFSGPSEHIHIYKNAFFTVFVERLLCLFSQNAGFQYSFIFFFLLVILYHLF